MNDFRALRIHSRDRVGEGVIEHTTLDALDEGDVVIKTAYAGLNYKDALAVTGAAPIVRRYPCIAGIEAVGEIVASDADGLVPGDAVIVHGCGLGVSHDGGFSEYVRVPADWVLKLPDGLSMAEAGAIGVAGHTVAVSIDLMELNGVTPEAGPIAVTGATGGVAGLSIDILARRGYEVVAVSRSAEHDDYLVGLGANRCLRTPSVGVADKIKPLEKSEWAGAVDSAGGTVLAWLLRTMKEQGVIASFGNAAGLDVQTTVLPFILRGVRLIGVNANTPMAYRRHLWGRLASDLKPESAVHNTTWIRFDELENTMQKLVQGTARGRYVVDFT